MSQCSFREDELCKEAVEDAEWRDDPVLCGILYRDVPAKEYGHDLLSHIV